MSISTDTSITFESDLCTFDPEKSATSYLFTRFLPPSLQPYLLVTSREPLSAGR